MSSLFAPSSGVIIPLDAPTTPTTPRPPRNIAYTGKLGDELLEAGDDLEQLLALLLAEHDPTTGEDIAVWEGGKLVALLLETGQLLRCDGQTSAAPCPASAARLPSPRTRAPSREN